MLNFFVGYSELEHYSFYNRWNWLLNQKHNLVPDYLSNFLNDSKIGADFQNLNCLLRFTEEELFEHYFWIEERHEFKLKKVFKAKLTALMESFFDSCQDLKLDWEKLWQFMATLKSVNAKANWWFYHKVFVMLLLSKGPNLLTTDKKWRLLPKYHKIRYKYFILMLQEAYIQVIQHCNACDFAHQ